MARPDIKHLNNYILPEQISRVHPSQAHDEENELLLSNKSFDFPPGFIVGILNGWCFHKIGRGFEQ